MSTNKLKEQFKTVYRSTPSFFVRSPGRVNLIGEHTDYNDGFVLPIAIERQITAAVAPRDDREVRFASTQTNTQVDLNLDNAIHPGEPAWANYCRGVAAGLVEAGLELTGADILFSSDIPLGGGLSSSAALEVATALCLLAAAGKPDAVSQRDLALLCQKAEHDFASAPCGIMDQSIVIMGQAGRALLLDCRDGATRQIPFDDGDHIVLVVDTKVKHDIADGGYAARRDQCFAAAKKLGIKSLRDADAAMIASAEKANVLTDKELARARHIVGEIDRTLQAVAAMETGDYGRFGELMYASHESMRDDHEISCDELDEVVALARDCKGVYGARMTGGGFGGCAIILADTDRADAISQTVTEGFTERFGHACLIFATRAAAGASIITGG